MVLFIHYLSILRTKLLTRLIQCLTISIRSINPFSPLRYHHVSHSPSFSSSPPRPLAPPRAALFVESTLTMHIYCYFRHCRFRQRGNTVDVENTELKVNLDKMRTAIHLRFKDINSNTRNDIWHRPNRCEKLRRNIAFTGTVASSI